MASNYSLEARERKVRRKAREAGYRVSKGFQHRLYNNSVVRDCNGVAYTGYDVVDLNTGYSVPWCYNQWYDHLWTLEDVEEFIKGEYEKAEMKY